MGAVARPPDPIRDLLGLDPRLRNSLIHTGGRRWGPQDPWNYFGAVGQPGLISPWRLPPSSDGVHNPRWYRDTRNIVHLSGSVSASIGTTSSYTILVMPPGLRPAIPFLRWMAASSASLSWSYVYMGSNGAIVVASIAAGEQWVSLDGLSYSLN
jgi:hypothetical protein